MRSVLLTVFVMGVVAVPGVDAQVLTRANLHPRVRTQTQTQGGGGVPAPVALSTGNTNLTLDQTTIKVSQGQQTVLLLDVLPNATYNGLVSLSFTFSPASSGLSVQFVPNVVNVVAGQKVTVKVLITTLAKLTPGEYAINIDAMDSGGTSTVSVDLTAEESSQDLFSQGSIQFSSSDGSKPAISIQALDFYFGEQQAGVMSIRATLPTASSTGPGGSITAGPNENLRSQLLDAFGGVLNLSGGWQPQTDGHWSADFRGALKLVEVPNDVSKGGQDGYSQSPFLSASANVKYSVQGKGQGHIATLVLVGSYFFNAVPDAKTVARFTTPLNRVSQGANASLTLTVPDLHFYVLGQFRWSSDAQLGHQFVFSVNPTK